VRETFGSRCAAGSRVLVDPAPAHLEQRRDLVNREQFV